MNIERIDFVSIPVEDQKRALGFYVNRLGFEVSMDVAYADDWRWIFLARGPSGTRLHFARKQELTWSEGMPALALLSSDVDGDAERLAAEGVEIVHGPEDTPWGAGGRFVQIRDSEGNIVLIQSEQAAAQAETPGRAELKVVASND